MCRSEINLINNKIIIDEVSEIEQFYENKSVFITGGTGFLGSVLIEKLLRSCTKIKKIFVLIRSKSPDLIDKKLEIFLKNKIFDNIRSQNDKLFEKIKPISGNILYPGLGINYEDLCLLSNEVNIVIHSAATIRFDEFLKTAILVNLCGTEKVLNFCNELNNLFSFIHISTAYCNTIKDNIEEKIYEQNIPVEKILELNKWMNSELFEKLSEILYDGRPSSYHYTKALAESYIYHKINDKNFKKNFKTAIIRPSIITPSLNEPFQGWTNNYYGPTGYLIVNGKGVLRSFLALKDNICDIVPVDIVVNTTISISYYIHKNIDNTLNDIENLNNNLIIINCVTGNLNPISWGEVHSLSTPFLLKYPSEEIFRYPNVKVHSNKLLHKIIIKVEHNIPALIIDFVFKILGFKPILTPVYERVHKSLNVLEHFTTNQWTWKTENFENLINFQNNIDKKKFFIDVRKINWKNYMENYVLGVRQYLLEEDPSTIPNARLKLNSIYYLTQLLKIGLFGGFLYQFYTRYPTIKKYIYIKFIKN